MSLEQNSILIWIDQNIDNNENIDYLKEFEKKKSYDIFTFKNENDGLKKIKEIKFRKTFIIINGSSYHDFIFKFINQINNIYIIPIIIIFTKDKNSFIENNKDIKEIIDNEFYNLGGIQSEFESIKTFIEKSNETKNYFQSNNSMSHSKNIDEKFFSIEKIDKIEQLFLPLYYKTLIEINSSDNFKYLTQILMREYSNDITFNLLSQIRMYEKIPNEILSKFYSRIYTIESNFLQDLNNKILEGNIDEFIPYIKILFEGIKINSLLSSTDNNLYYSTYLDNSEFNLIRSNLQNNNNVFPSFIIFSKFFMSFTKNKESAQKILSKNIFNKVPVLFELEKNNLINKNLNTHFDSENISYIVNDKTVLFLPFSSFEIKEIKEIKDNGKIFFQINLDYLSKYDSFLRNCNKNINVNEIIPSSLFKEEFMKFTIFNDSNFSSFTIKNLLDYVKNYKNEIISFYQISKKDINKSIYIINNKTNNIAYDSELYLNGEKIDFCSEYKFQNEGQYILNIKSKTKISNIERIFYQCLKLKSLDFSFFNSDNINNAMNIVSGCSKLTYLNLTNFNSSNLTNMSGMFSYCSSLTSLNLSSFNTNNVYNMSRMFFYCSSLTSLNLSNFNTNNVKDMSQLFMNCSSLTELNISNFNTNNVEDMCYMFAYCSSLTSLNLSNLNTNNVEDMNHMFYNCSRLTSLNLSNFNTNNVCNMSGMFLKCSSLTSLNLSNFNTNNVINMSGMFSNCSSLSSLNLTNFETNDVEDMSEMFLNCESLTYLNISTFKTEKVINMNKMFQNCSTLDNLDLSKFTTKEVERMDNMFNNCAVLSSLNLSNFNTEKVINMSYMFQNCYSLTELNLSNFNTKNVINMNRMFSDCESLINLDLSNFNTKNVINMKKMFFNCSSLKNISNISNFNTENVIDMKRMFYNCSSLENLNLCNFRTENVNDMSEMFEDCSSLMTLEISNFKTQKVKNMSSMFCNCISLLSLDISGFKTTNFTKVQDMFNGSKKIINIKTTDNKILNELSKI